MTAQQIFQKDSINDNPVGYKKLLGTLSGIFVFIVSLTIFQDYLDSLRSNYSFYFSESILFKTIWFLFIPLLTILYKKLLNKNLNTLPKTIFFIITPIIAHFITLICFFYLFSVIFYEGGYHLYKIFSYTLANDFYILVIVYSSFVMGYKYFSTLPIIENLVMETFHENIIISNGKVNTVIKVNDILQITAATPYITIHLENKKYLHTATLKSICNQLDDTIFLRIHKSTIVNKDKVISFKSRLNGDYDLLLKNGVKTRLSRTYAASFKTLFKTNHRVTIKSHQVKSFYFHTLLSASIFVKNIIKNKKV